MTWDELPDVDPRDFTMFTVPDRVAEVGDPHAEIDDVQHSIEPLLELYEAERPGGDALPARLPQDARRAAPRAAEPKSGCELGKHI